MWIDRGIPDLVPISMLSMLPDRTPQDDSDTRWREAVSGRWQASESNGGIDVNPTCPMLAGRHVLYRPHTPAGIVTRDCYNPCLYGGWADPDLTMPEVFPAKFGRAIGCRIPTADPNPRTRVRGVRCEPFSQTAYEISRTVCSLKSPTTGSIVTTGRQATLRKSPTGIFTFTNSAIRRGNSGRSHKKYVLHRVTATFNYFPTPYSQLGVKIQLGQPHRFCRQPHGQVFFCFSRQQHNRCSNYIVVINRIP